MENVSVRVEGFLAMRMLKGSDATPRDSTEYGVVFVPRGEGGPVKQRFFRGRNALAQFMERDLRLTMVEAIPALIRQVELNGTASVAITLDEAEIERLGLGMEN